MGDHGVERRSLRGLVAALVLLCAPLVLSACASSSYMGIPFASGAADAELQTLARRAQAGDKQAQLELGIRYEEGRGVPVDLARAERLYRMAASDSGGTTYVYSPPLRTGDPARVIRVDQRPSATGLAEARNRLWALAPPRAGGSGSLFPGSSPPRALKPGAGRSNSEMAPMAISPAVPLEQSWRRLIDYLVGEPEASAALLWNALGIDAAQLQAPRRITSITLARRADEALSGRIDVGYTVCPPAHIPLSRALCIDGRPVTGVSLARSGTARRDGCLSVGQLSRQLEASRWRRAPGANIREGAGARTPPHRVYEIFSRDHLSVRVAPFSDDPGACVVEIRLSQIGVEF